MSETKRSDSGVTEAIELLTDVARAIADTAGDNMQAGRTTCSYLRLPPDPVQVSQAQFTRLISRMGTKLPSPSLSLPLLDGQVSVFPAVS